MLGKSLQVAPPLQYKNKIPFGIWRESIWTRHSRGGLLFVVSPVCSPHAGRALPLERTKGSKVRQRSAGPCRAKALRLPLFPRPVRSENRFKSPLRSGAGTKFISFRSSKRGPSTPFPCPRFSEKSPACFACSVGKRPHNGSTALATFFGMLR